jgi:DNA polymerase-4
MAGACEMNIIHCDLDAFFASVEQRDNPSLRGKPVIVGGPPRSRGVVSTCSYEARQYGVRSAMPAAQALRLCPQGIFLPVDMKRYQKASQEVFRILSDYTPLIEPLSIDEAFLDVKGCTALFGTAEVIARTIKQRVRDEVGLIISTGISYNKFLAKLATELGKPDGLKVIRREEAQSVLDPLPVSYLWGVGRKTQQIFEQMGIKTIGEVRCMPMGLLQKRLGSSAQAIMDMACGVDRRELETNRIARSMGRETTFAQDVADRELLETTLLDFSEQLGRRLRRSGLRARSITLKIRYHNFKTITRRTTLPVPICSDLEIYKVAVSLLQETPTGQVRLIGLQVELDYGHELVQGNIFDCKQEEDKLLDQTIDQLRERFGNQAITRASLIKKKRDNEDYPQ